MISVRSTIFYACIFEFYKKISYLHIDRSAANIGSSNNQPNDPKQYGQYGGNYNPIQAAPPHHIPQPHFNPGHHMPHMPSNSDFYNQAGIFNNQLNGCSSSPCFNNAYCQSTGQYSFYCQCRQNYFGVRCERYHNPKGVLLGIVLGTVLPLFAIIIIVSIIIYICCLRRTKKY